MRHGLTDKEFNYLAETSVETRKEMERGVALEARTGKTLQQLMELVVSDRLRLAGRMRTSAQLLQQERQFRSSVSRSYYAMYNTFRAVVFWSERGDDHQKHAELPKHLPGDFPDRAVWSNVLKTARQNRNRADYESLPLRPEVFEPISTQQLTECARLARVAHSWLRLKGCQI